MMDVGFSGNRTFNAAALTGFTNAWNWGRVTMSGGDPILNLSTTSEHMLEAWMREDGQHVDRVLLITDTNYIPTGAGPAESSLQTITKTVPVGWARRILRTSMMPSTG
jgi:hypothetical protein